ncbi:hypothetical protein PIB30_087237 [Stylosanthes scabra]|uniref:Uncharacterized protein n=1 Tax=Stylosanthes scabra TaxID=79078 RepID=A0ABU6ZSN4_9FABA|nr:hypothetical protein [Stylosanthes scabra]
MTKSPLISVETILLLTFYYLIRSGALAGGEPELRKDFGHQKCTRVDRDAPPPPPRLSQMPVERWFEEDDERVAYDERLSRMEILPPKYIGDRVLPEEKYPDLWRLIDIQGLHPFLYMRER